VPLIVGFRSSPTRTITQGDGTAYGLDAGKLKEFVRKYPERDGNSIALARSSRCKTPRSQHVIGSMMWKRGWQDG
jgi:hypothetical protein